MNKPKTIVKGEAYDTKQLVDIGVIPPEFLIFVDDVPVGYPNASRVTNVDHDNRIITFDSEVTECSGDSKREA